MAIRRVTAAEAQFVTEMLRRIPDLQDWYHQDSDGAQRVCISYHFVVDHGIRGTLRLDYDATAIRGGWSPASLNWDDGVRAEAAGVILTPPDGIARDGSTPLEAADAAAA